MGAVEPSIGGLPQSQGLSVCERLCGCSTHADSVVSWNVIDVPYGVEKQDGAVGATLKCTLPAADMSDCTSWFTCPPPISLM